MKKVVFWVISIGILLGCPTLVQGLELTKDMDVSSKVDNNYQIEGFNDVLIDGSNYIAVGYATNENKNGIGVIVKYDNKGSLIWLKQYALDNKDVHFDKVIKSQSGYIALANGNNPRTQGYTSRLVWFDNNGKVMRTSIILDVKHYIYFTDIYALDNNYVAVGESNAGNIFGFNSSSAKGIIIKYDNNGNIVEKKSTSAGDNTGFLKVKASGNSLIALGFKDNKVLYSNFDKNLTQEVTKEIDLKTLRDFIVTSDNNLLLVGMSSSGINKLIKVDLDGNVIWNKDKKAGSSTNVLLNVFEYKNEYFINEVVFKNTEDLGNNLLLKYDTKGNLVCEYVVGQNLTKVINDSKGNILAVGVKSEGNYINNTLQKYSFKENNADIKSKKDKYKITIHNKTTNVTQAKESASGVKLVLKELVGPYDEISVVDDSGNKVVQLDGAITMPKSDITIDMTTEATVNPKTGSIVSIVVVTLGALTALGIINFTKKKNKFMK